MIKPSLTQPIGIFDSGFGGLTILKEIVSVLPQYDFLYLGDNARAPYGSRSFESVYEYTLQSVEYLFNQNCSLVILACNTASAKALRSIQQKNLPIIAPNKRVLGVIRPTTEIIGQHTKTKHVGLLATSGTVSSASYLVEIEKFYPELHVYQEACPMWVPLIENNEFNNEGADYFIKKHCQNLMQQQPLIDTVILGCTHYPLIASKIQQYLPPHVKLVMQGPIVANGVKDYLKRHPEIDQNCSQNSTVTFLTTDFPETFNKSASLFYNQQVEAHRIVL